MSSALVNGVNVSFMMFLGKALPLLHVTLALTVKAHPLQNNSPGFNRCGREG